MKLLFDENLSYKLVESLHEEFPDSTHARSAGLRGAGDDRVWDFARHHDLTIVSKDNDFRQRSFVHGPPPKVVWLDVGNAGTSEIADLLRRERPTLEAFARDPETALLVVALVVS